MRRAIIAWLEILTGRHLQLYFSSPKVQAAPTPQAAAPPPAPIRPPSQTDMQAQVVNPEQRRKSTVTRAKRIFGSAGYSGPTSSITEEYRLGGGSTKTGVTY